MNAKGTTKRKKQTFYVTAYTKSFKLLIIIRQDIIKQPEKKFHLFQLKKSLLACSVVEMTR